MNYREEIEKRAKVLYYTDERPERYAYIEGAESMLPIIEAKDNEIAALKESKWIRVEDFKPDFTNQVNEIIESSEKYLVFDGIYGSQVAAYIRYKTDTIDPFFPERKKGYILWETGNYNLYNVTHYQPLPEKP